MVGWSIARLVSSALNVYSLILLIRVIMSWLPQSTFRSPSAASFGRIIYALTEPLLAPIRRALRPYMGNAPIDFSPLILYLLLQVAGQLIWRMA